MDKWPLSPEAHRGKSYSALTIQKTVRKFPAGRVRNDWFTLAVISIIGAATVGSAAGQVITKIPNNFGLDIQSVTIDEAAFAAKIAFRNTSGRPIAAYAVTLPPSYSDGEKLDGGGFVDFFGTLGLARIIPAGPGTDPNGLDALFSGATRTSTFVYRKPLVDTARLVALSAKVVAVIFEDESAVGDPVEIDDIVRVRDAQSTEIARWCSDVKRFSGGPLPKEAVNGILAAHGPAPKTEGRPAPGRSMAEAQRSEMLTIFRQGLTWQSDGTATMLPLVRDVLDAKCSIASQHLKIRELLQ